MEYPIADAAERFFSSGPSLLQRYLPFWAANLIDRLKIMLLPLLALAYPFYKLIPPTYDWRMRSRVARWYKDLQRIQTRVEAGASRDEVRVHLNELEQLEHTVRRLVVPVTYGNSLYSLQLHIVMLRDELRDAMENRSNTQSDQTVSSG